MSDVLCGVSTKTELVGVAVLPTAYTPSRSPSRRSARPPPGSLLSTRDSEWRIVRAQGAFDVAVRPDGTRIQLVRPPAAWARSQSGRRGGQQRSAIPLPNRGDRAITWDSRRLSRRERLTLHPMREHGPGSATRRASIRRCSRWRVLAAPGRRFPVMWSGRRWPQRPRVDMVSHRCGNLARDARHGERRSTRAGCRTA